MVDEGEEIVTVYEAIGHILSVLVRTGFMKNMDMIFATSRLISGEIYSQMAWNPHFGKQHIPLDGSRYINVVFQSVLCDRETVLKKPVNLTETVMSCN